MLNTERVLIIAEIGTNHNGRLDTAFTLIDAAADAGADVCKFQSFLVDDLLAHDDQNFQRLKTLELPREWYPQLMKRCADRGVRFLSTATNERSLGWMEEDGAWGYKVASCNITHRPLLDMLLRIGKPLIISTGMATLDEILELERHFLSNGFAQYAFLHCVSKYPAPAETLRLRNIAVLRELLKSRVGFSDHSKSPHLAVAAVTLGASIVEKHITLDGTGAGMDHDVAIPPDQFAQMCSAIRETEAALVTDFTPDRENMRTMRRSIRFSRNLAAGAVISRDDLKITRPEDGLAPKHLDALLGLRLTAPVQANQPSDWTLFEKACPTD